MILSLRQTILFLYFFLSAVDLTLAQQINKPVLKVSEATHDYAEVQDISTLLSEFIIINKGTAILYLLKADAPRGFIVDAKKKMLAPGDSTVLAVRFKPVGIGFFNETIKLYSNAGNEPVNIKIKGFIKSLAKDPMACYSFNTKTTTGPVNPLFVATKGKVINSKTGAPIADAHVRFVKNNAIFNEVITPLKGNFSTQVPLGLYRLDASASNYYPTTQQQYINKNTPEVIVQLNPLPDSILNLAAQKALQENPAPQTIIKIDKDTVYTPAVNSELDETMFGPNNVVFLIDISGSMQDSLKLPLLKNAINKLISALRRIDKLAIVTYSDSARIFIPSTSASEKTKLISSINTLKAKGRTAGSQGISMAYKLLKESYLEGGNNQLVLATDGIFKLSPKDEILISSDSLKQINFSILSFGTDKWALDRLRILAQKNNGNFMFINNEDATATLLEDVKLKSKK